MESPLTAPRIASLLAVTAALLTPAGARAQITIGQLPPGTPTTPCTSGPFDLWQSRVAAGSGYTAPAPGMITSWSTTAAAGGDQQLEFKVFRPNGANSVLVVAHDGPRKLTPNAVNTFPVQIPVQAGDIIGLNDLNASLATPNACQFETGDLRDGLVGAGGNVSVGGTIPFNSAAAGDRFRMNVAARVLLAPTISSVSPATSPFRGGTEVTIRGSEFAEVKEVDFGRAPAFLFKVDSESQITAIAPGLTPINGISSIDAPVTIITAAGTAFSPGSFSFRGCRSPRLVGRTLRAAVKLLRKAGCRPGTVKRHFGVTAKAHKVVRQRPEAGKVLAPGARINLTVVDRPADV
jgi:hypothetical protein